MGCAQLMRRNVWPAEHYGGVELAGGHLHHVRGVVYYLVERYQGKAKGHEFDYWAESNHRCADTESGKTAFADRCVEHPLRAELVEEPLTDFVGPVVFGNLFAQQENVRVALHLFIQRLVDGLAVADFSHWFEPSMKVYLCNSSRGGSELSSAKRRDSAASCLASRSNSVN